ncbi:MAG: hypothetical protein U0670_15175 [Anaerolineae bacterium]
MTRRRDDYYDDRDYRPRRRSSRRSYDDRGYDSRSSNRRYDNYRSGGGYRRRRKSEREARIERITWGLLVLVFAVLYFLPGVSFPNWLVPFSGAVILIGSGVYQYGQRFRVSPITWMAGAVLALFSYYSFQSGANMTPFTLLTFAAIIVLGIVTGET